MYFCFYRVTPAPVQFYVKSVFADPIEGIASLFPSQGFKFELKEWGVEHAVFMYVYTKEENDSRPWRPQRLTPSPTPSNSWPTTNPVVFGPTTNPVVRPTTNPVVRPTINPVVIGPTTNPVVVGPTTNPAVGQVCSIDI